MENSMQLNIQHERATIMYMTAGHLLPFRYLKGQAHNKAVGGQNNSKDKPDCALFFASTPAQRTLSEFHKLIM